MKKAVWIVLVVFMTAATAFSAYHHQGEMDSDKFLSAYPDKAGGWTLVTLSGDTMRIAGDAAVLAWEAFAGAGAAMGDVAAQLAARFDRVPSAVLEEDLNRFAWELLCCGFVELVPEPPRSSPAR